MVTKLIFCHKMFSFFKNGQKKCPILKIPKNFPTKKSKNFNTFVKTFYKEKNTKIKNYISINGEKNL